MSQIYYISPPDISFAHDYRAHVLPQLTSLMPVSACMIVVGGASFAEEYDSIVRVGWHLGGWFLPPNLWCDLESWTYDQLLVAIDAIEAEFGEFTELEDQEAANDFSMDIIYEEIADVG